MVACQGCGEDTESQLCCPACSEFGRTSIFCSQECFKTNWASHNKLHQLLKQSQFLQFGAPPAASNGSASASDENISSEGYPQSAAPPWTSSSLPGASSSSPPSSSAFFPLNGSTTGSHLTQTVFQRKISPHPLTLAPPSSLIPPTGTSSRLAGNNEGNGAMRSISLGKAADADDDPSKKTPLPWTTTIGRQFRRYFGPLSPSKGYPIGPTPSSLFPVVERRVVPIAITRALTPLQGSLRGYMTRKGRPLWLLILLAVVCGFMIYLAAVKMSSNVPIRPKDAFSTTLSQKASEHSSGVNENSVLELVAAVEALKASITEHEKRFSTIERSVNDLARGRNPYSLEGNTLSPADSTKRREEAPHVHHPADEDMEVNSSKNDKDPSVGFVRKEEHGRGKDMRKNRPNKESVGNMENLVGG